MQRPVALITGASRGIGAACARRFAAAGWDLALQYHQSEAQARALFEEVQSLGARVLLVNADVAERAQVQKMVDTVLENFCHLDSLLCSAGIAQTGLFQELCPADWRRLFAVNVDGLYHCIQAALPQFLSQKSGSIITLSSIWGQTGASCEVAYSATKAAVIGLTRALAKELGPSGIRVNCLAPGLIDTDMNATLSAEDKAAIAEETPLGRMGTSSEVADCALFLASESASFLTGQVLAPNGGLLI